MSFLQKLAVKYFSQYHSKAFLKDIGIKKGQVILDFGCGAGHYGIRRCYKRDRKFKFLF